MNYLKKEDKFEDIIKDKKVLVDFYADWCGPCKMISPILETITEVEVLKVNVDEFGELSQKFGVMSIPTLIYFENGTEKNKAIGFKNKEEILKMIN